MTALSVRNVVKQFKKEEGGLFTAVNDVSFTIEPGTIHGLLGPNGAGKSTLINMISGVMEPTSGGVFVFDQDVIREADKTKSLIGVVPQEIVTEMAFTVEEILYYYGGMFGVPMRERKARIAELLNDLQLADKATVRARTLSGGMKRRLMIAKAMMHRPKLLILDEPTAGVDVALRQRLWDFVRRLNKEGTTILFTTHYMEEAEQLCDTITLINKGQIVKQGKLKDIQKEFSKNTIHFELFERNVEHLPTVKAIGSEFEYPMTNLADDMARISRHYGSNIKSIKSEAASLEHIFLTLTDNT